MKLLAVFGTRPEAIKMAPVIKAFSKHPFFNINVCVTAQHRSMLDQVLSLHHIVPKYDLNIMTTNQTLLNVTQKTLTGLEKIFTDDCPDWILVQGDTNTTFAASLAAYYHKIPVAHIEAGLRTHHIYSPWPEEINRQLTSRIAKLHFAPTAMAEKNLLAEGVSQDDVLVTGNTVIDALVETVDIIKNDAALNAKLKNDFSFIDPCKKMILLTSHRRENFGAGLQAVCRALLHVSRRDDVQIIYPVHLNPNIQGPVNEYLANKKNIFLLGPQDYLPFVYLMLQSYLIVTDSGGVQEEAPTLGKPVLVARDTTERPEGIAAGSAKLVGTDEEKIIKHVENLLDDPEYYKRMNTVTNPYGDGFASQRIVERLHDRCRIQ